VWWTISSLGMSAELRPRLWYLGPRLDVGMDVCMQLRAVILKVGAYKPGNAELAPGVRRVDRAIERRVAERAVPDNVLVGHLVDGHDETGQASAVTVNVCPVPSGPVRL
jgi:hypothetical protein